MSRLLINEPPLMVLPSLAVKIGLNEAIFVQQLHYLLQMSHNERDGNMWVYNTNEEWGNIFPFLSSATIRRTIKSLEDAGIVISSTKMNRYKIDRTKWFSINYQALEAIAQNDQMDCSKRSNASDQNEQLTSDQNDQMTSDQNEQTNNHKNKTTTKTTSKREGQAPTQPKFNALNELLKLGANEQHAKDWLANRKKKLTQTALKALIREAGKGGISIAYAVEVCAERCWESYQSHYNLGQAPQGENNATYPSNPNRKLSAVERVRLANERARAQRAAQNSGARTDLGIYESDLR